MLRCNLRRSCTGGFLIIALICLRCTSVAYAWVDPTYKQIEDVVSAGIVRLNISGILVINGKKAPYETVGTGFLISNTQLFTAAHLFPEGLSEVKIEAQIGYELQRRDTAQTYHLTFLDKDDGLDIAILSFATPPKRARALSIAFKIPEIGDELHVLGFAAGSSFLTDDKVTYEHGDENFFEYHGIANKGNSGGPIINMQGDVVGLVSREMKSISGVDVEGINRAAVLKSFDVEYMHMRPESGILVENPFMFHDIPDFIYNRDLAEHDLASTPREKKCGVMLPSTWSIIRGTDYYEVHPRRNPEDYGNLYSDDDFFFRLENVKKGANTIAKPFYMSDWNEGKEEILTSRMLPTNEQQIAVSNNAIGSNGWDQEPILIWKEKNKITNNWRLYYAESFSNPMDDSKEVNAFCSTRPSIMKPNLLDGCEIMIEQAVESFLENGDCVSVEYYHHF